MPSSLLPIATMTGLCPVSCTLLLTRGTGDSEDSARATDPPNALCTAGVLPGCARSPPNFVPKLGLKDLSVAPLHLPQNLTAPILAGCGGRGFSSSLMP